MATNYKFVGGHRCGALTVAGTSTCPLSHQAPYPWHGAIHHKDHMETCIFCEIGNYAWLLSDSLHRRVGGRTEVRNTCPFIKALISLSGIGGDVWEDMVAMETELNLGIIGCARGSLPHPRQLTFQSTIAPPSPLFYLLLLRCDSRWQKRALYHWRKQRSQDAGHFFEDDTNALSESTTTHIKN